MGYSLVIGCYKIQFMAVKGHNCTEAFSMDWFDGKSSPETIDFAMKYGVFRLKKTKTHPLT